ncbi:hypothetical protein BJF83_08785 [Nocardiopsis sp. CNR-923]|uniref:toll/interleukin-1 receptor domain-containing protein n=1 Tax=Nocardiopsis sp. CNR-923 TaxID=1904965 RepID=UPI00095EB18F|nr:toll/interleukin-1 receptor domain-containing protein [Nocardiopsis sp. CNR-923]OLT30375.1 hypothetical protein BJF83_08785 [Nocardiopsis sp. CNR-923]
MKAPHFFLSYGDRAPEREYVQRFLRDLERAVRLQGHEETRAVSGPTLTPGPGWKRRLLKECATVGCLVALLSDRYFRSDWCAKEWWTVDERIRRRGDHTDAGVPWIIPVIWRPLSSPIPDAIRSQQRTDWYVHQDARRRGVLHLMDRDNQGPYRETCQTIATLVVEAFSHDLPALDDGQGPQLSWDASAWRRPKQSTPVPEPPPELSPSEKLVHILSHVPSLDEEDTWSRFLDGIARSRPMGVPLQAWQWPHTSPSPERHQNLLKHLCTQYRRAHVFGWVADALESSTGATGHAQAIRSIRDDLPEE